MKQAKEYLIPIVNMQTLENYYREDYSTKGNLIESIGQQFLKLYNFNTVPITTKLLQKTQGDTVGTMVIPNLANKQATIEFKSGCNYNGYNELCIDLEYFTKEGLPYANSGTNIGWLFTTVSDFIITVVPKSKKLYFMNWYNGLHSTLIRAYSLFIDNIELLPSWATIDLITIDKNKNTKVLRLNLDKLIEEFPQFISEYKLIGMDEYCNILEKELA